MQDDPLDAQRRFYAVPEAGRMECPQCGTIILWGKGQGHPDHRYWNEIACTLRCPACRTTYQLGVLAWPLRVGGDSGAAEDQQADMRQLAQIRARAGGVYMALSKARKEKANRYSPAGCTCAPLPWRLECAIHGALRSESVVDSVPASDPPP